MARLTAEKKRGVLRTLWRQCPDGQKWEDFLGAFQDSAFASVKAGKTITGTSGGGYSVNFSNPEMWREFSPDEVFALSEEFCGLYDDSVATLATGGNNEPTDQDIFNTMIAADQMQTVRELQRDYTMLRWPAVGVRSS